MWQQPIYDRTLFDVQTKSAKAYINTADINRIENNIGYMAQELHCTTVVTKQWIDGEFIFLSDVERMKSNLEQLRRAMPLTDNSPDIPELPFVTHHQWNDIEKILQDMYDLFYINSATAFFCGEVYMGEDTGVI